MIYAFLLGLLLGLVIPPMLIMWAVLREFKQATKMYKSARMVTEAYAGREDD